VPGLHVLPMIVANSDLVAVIPGRLADAFAARVPIKVLPPPVAMPQFGVCIHWHERYHREPGIQWLRGFFMRLRLEQSEATLGHVVTTKQTT